MDTLAPSITAVDQAQQIFAHHPHLNRREVRCRTEDDRVILEGNVESFFEKQLAQEALRDLQGVTCVDNQLMVTPS